MNYIEKKKKEFEESVVYLNCPNCGKDCKDHIRVYKYDDIHQFLESSLTELLEIVKSEVSKSNNFPPTTRENTIARLLQALDNLTKI